jgi:maltose O-acetyltransferase
MTNIRFKLIDAVQRSSIVPQWRRKWLLWLMGISAGKKSQFRQGIIFTSPRISFGAGCSINRDVFFEATEFIRVGDNVHIAPQACIMTASHDIADASRRCGIPCPRPINIGHGAWIGARAMILPGAHVAAGCVIAAGAVVTRPTEANGLYAGVPAVRVRDLL